MRATSVAPTWWWMGAATAPLRQQAWNRTSASHQFGSCQETTSPRRTPRARSPAATESASRSKVRESMPVSPSTIAAASGNRGVESNRSSVGTSQAPPLAR